MPASTGQSGPKQNRLGIACGLLSSTYHPSIGCRRATTLLVTKLDLPPRQTREIYVAYNAKAKATARRTTQRSMGQTSEPNSPADDRHGFRLGSALCTAKWQAI